MTKKKKITILSIVALLVLVLIAVLAFFGFQSYRVGQAQKLLDEGDTLSALEILKSVNSQKATAKRKEIYINLYGKEFVEQVYSSKPGDEIVFGSYEQDEIFDNGNEPVEWVVLEKDGEGRALVITKQVLECIRYHFKPVEVTWETSDVRNWLNGDFMDYTFSPEEQMIIATTRVVNDDNPVYGTDGGNDTEDQLFFLSIDEVNRYFSADIERKCKGTRYALCHYAHTDAFGHSPWWLRSPSLRSDLASLVSDEGEVMDGALHKVSDRSIGIRPCMWIDLD